jgi:hypothetical protein
VPCFFSKTQGEENWWHSCDERRAAGYTFAESLDSLYQVTRNLPCRRQTGVVTKYVKYKEKISCGKFSVTSSVVLNLVRN